MGDELPDIDTEIIYGQGGWNRYQINPFDGTVSLGRSKDVTTGGEQYGAALVKKAQELGLKVEQ